MPERDVIWTRRELLTRGVTLLSGAVAGELSRDALVQAKSSGRDLLLYVFQRGAADGLNIVVPHAEAQYYSVRSNIAIAQPGKGKDAALDLDGFFGLHPSLAPLKRLYDAKLLAAVHACGSPDPTPSPFHGLG